MSFREEYLFGCCHFIHKVTRCAYFPDEVAKLSTVADRNDTSEVPIVYFDEKMDSHLHHFSARF